MGAHLPLSCIPYESVQLGDLWLCFSILTASLGLACRTPHILPVQYAAQIGPLHNAGFATAAYDYLGCGRGEKPNQYDAYAASELYADLQAFYRRYTEVRYSRADVPYTPLVAENHRLLHEDIPIVLLFAGLPCICLTCTSAIAPHVHQPESG